MHFPLIRRRHVLTCVDPVTVNLPANSAIQYKYIRKDGSSVTWESDPNMQITTPASGTYTANDSWR